MLTEFITEIDFTILNWIQEHLKCDILDKVMPVFTSIGNKGALFILMAVVLLCISKYRKWGAALACSLFLGFLFGNLLIKNIVARVRPYDQAANITLLIDKLKDYSFPSGHTMAAFEFFAVLCMMPVKKRYKILAGIVAFTMAFSRLYLQVHFPSDVLGGMLLGTLFGVMGVRIVDMLMEEYKKKDTVESDCL